MRCPAIDRLPIYKAIVRSNRHRTGVMRIGVIVVGPVDCIHVVNIGVVDVDVVPVPSASVIPGMICLAPAQREPAHAEAYSNPEAKTASSEEADKRRSIIRTRINRARAPAP